MEAHSTQGANLIPPILVRERLGGITSMYGREKSHLIAYTWDKELRSTHQPMRTYIHPCARGLMRFAPLKEECNRDHCRVLARPL